MMSAQSPGSVMVHRISCSAAYGIFPGPEIKLFGRQILIHCIHREVLEPYLLLVLNVSLCFTLSYSKTSEYVTCFGSMLKPFNIHPSHSNCFFFFSSDCGFKDQNSIKLAQVKGFLRVI